MCFLLMFSNKNSHARIKKLVKMFMELFWKFFILTENLINFDVTCSVILGTVYYVTKITSYFLCDRHNISSIDVPNYFGLSHPRTIKKHLANNFFMFQKFKYFHLISVDD